MRGVITCLLLFIGGACLADPITITDARGPQSFAAIPARIAALDWSVTEALLDLGITPVGVAEPDAYGTWVVDPPLPAGITDLGLRAEPNLEALVALAPDVIVTADLDPALVPALEKIAPVVLFRAFATDQDNAATARAIFLSLGTLTGTRALAEEQLTDQDTELDRISGRLAAHFGAPLPRVTAIRLNDAASVYVNGANSLPEYVLGRLGFSNEMPQPPSRWGITLVKAEALAALRDGIVLTIGPDMAGAALRETPIWGFLPFVRAGRVAATTPIWSYGGAMSIGRAARAYEAALMQISPAALPQINPAALPQIQPTAPPR